ncbi:hypothetical protein [Anaerocolumna xylanovorans]|uniref:Uncharacterized protein n=1 Tax=Anaerocolumna xylanovorans DSM 12503 TaxID=1121345 RepID=A0A1M7YM51_9FIRM|nr:hypothetical protein [Anaerocolumna xylanovorans]SHO53678.1 hypothetical protein SAMN02745217_04230 [Anaerocolumna xylanovorans DSM 12503]
MRNKDAQDKLRMVLQEKIAQLTDISLHPKTLVKELQKIMFRDFRVEYNITVDILNEIIRIETLSYDMLYKLMSSIKALCLENYTELDSSDLNEEEYFTEIEMKEFKKPIPKKEQNFNIVIKDGNWHLTDINPYNYITIHTDINEVYRWAKLGLLKFNPETQRDLIVIESNGVPVSQLDVNWRSVGEIQDRMVDGMYFPVQGTININPEINEKTVEIRGKDLIIPEGIQLDLIEGFHNYLAEIRSKIKNGNWNFPCEFRIVFLSTKSANRYIEQMDKKNHFKETQVVRLNVGNPYTYIINHLNTSGDYLLHGTIDDNMYVYLYDLLPEFFNEVVKEKNQKILVSEYLLESLNRIIVKTGRDNTPFSKEEWFCYIYLLKQNRNRKIDIIKIISDESFQTTLNSMVIKDKPVPRNYNDLNKIMKEVGGNV